MAVVAGAAGGAFPFVREAFENEGRGRAVVKIKLAGPNSVGSKGRAAGHGGNLR